MAAPSLTYSLTNGSTADASQVMQNFNDILNGITDGTKDITVNGIVANGAAVLNGHITLGSSTSDDLTVNANLASTIGVKTTFSYDIGTSTIGLRSIYLGDAGASTPTTRLIGADIASSWSFTFPTGVPATLGMFLNSDASGTTSWRFPDKVVASKTTTYTATLDETFIPVSGASGAWSLSLPAASTASGKRYVIKRTDDTPANAVTIDPNSSETIDGDATTTLNSKYEAIEILCDGSAWHTVQRRIDSTWKSDLTFTPNASGFDSVANSAFFYRRVGDSLEVSGYFTFGTANASNAYIALPTNYVADTAKIQGTTKGKLGVWEALNNAATTFGSNNLIGGVYFDASQTGRIYLARRGSSQIYDVENVNALFSNSTGIALRFTIPISGWKA